MDGDVAHFRKLWLQAREQQSETHTETRPIDQGPIRCLISYTTEDDENLRIVQPLLKSLQYWAQSNLGRSVEIWPEMQGLELGKDWHHYVASNLEEATVFVPLITINYLRSPHCREELFFYHSTAEMLGLSSAIVPAVLLGHDAISNTSSDLVARIVAQHQFVDLQAAVFEGVDSPAWRRDMAALARRVVQAAESMEQAISNQLAKGPGRPIAGSTLTRRDPLVANREIDDLVAQIRHNMDSINTLAQAYAEIISSIPSMISEVIEQVELSKYAMPEILNKFAKRNQPHLAQLASIAKELEAEAISADRAIRDVWTFAQMYQLDASMETELQTALHTSNQLSQLDAAYQSLSQFYDQIVIVELASYQARAALRPVRTSIQTVQGVLTMVRSWLQLLPVE
jgi:hypothetical protein